MNTRDFTPGELATLTAAWAAFRAHSNEAEDIANEGVDYSNRDDLTRVLAHGGDLDDLDVHMLGVAIANESNQATWDALAPKLQGR